MKKTDDETARRIVEYIQFTRHTTAARDAAHAYGIGIDTARNVFLRKTGITVGQYLKCERDKVYKRARDFLYNNLGVSDKVVADLFNVGLDRVSYWRVRKCGHAKTNKALSRLNALKQIIKKRPIARRSWYCRQLGCSPFVVTCAKEMLAAEGWDLELERKILIEQYLTDHPNATVHDIAAFFGVPMQFIINLNRTKVCDKTDQYKAISPPDDVMQDITTRGFFGVFLPPDCMRRYTQLYRQKKAEWERRYRECYE